MAIEYFCISDSDTDMLEQIAQLEREVNASRGAGLSYFETQSFIRYGRVYAALEYDEVLGAAYFLRDFDNPGRAFLYSVLTSPHEAGKGIGQSLLLSAFADLSESGVRMVEVMVSPRNAKALRIYRQDLGFHVINASSEEEISDLRFLILRKTLGESRVRG